MLALWIFLSLAAIVPIFLVRLPPLYDYHNWVFQGRVVADLLASRPDSADIVQQDYSLSFRPIPNLAAPVGVAAFTILFSPDLAGRLFLSFSVLFFASAYGYLVRSIQRRPTVMEFFGFPWAFGYFFYKGYISYLISLPLAFLVVAKLHRMTTRPDREPKFTDIVVVAAISALLYLSHLIGWLVFVIALLIYAGERFCKGEHRNAVKLLSSALPSFVMLLAYAMTRARGDPAPTLFYHHLILSKDKVISLVEPLMLFLRADPFSPLVPTFWMNVIVFVVLAGVLIANLDRHQTPARSILLIAGVLSAFALCIPISAFRDLNRPDERFVLPALLILLAAVGWKRFSPLRAGCLAAVILVIFGQHLVEDLRVSSLSQQISDATLATVPADVQVFSLTLHDGSIHGGCSPDKTGLSIGTATLRWIDIRRLEMTRTLRSNLLETSLVHEKQVADRPGLTAMVMTMDELRSQTAFGEHLEETYPYIELFGCDDDLSEVSSILDAEYAVVASGANFKVLRDREAEEPPLTGKAVD